MQKGIARGVCLCALTCLLATGRSLAVTIDTVPVGDVGNTGEQSGEGSGSGPVVRGEARICGAVGFTIFQPVELVKTLCSKSQ